MTLRKKLLTVFGALALLLLVTTAVTLWVIASWTQTSTATENHYKRSLSLQRVRAATFRAFKEVPDAVTGDDPDSDREFEQYIGVAKADFKTWEQLAEDQAEQKQVRQIRTAFNALETTARQTFTLVKQGRRREAHLLMEGKLEDNDFERFNQLSQQAVVTDRTRRDVIRRANEATRQTARIVLAIVAFATVSLISLLAAYLASDLFKPLGELKDALRRVAEGDYKPQLDDSRNDEFGEVNRAFNHMAKAVVGRGQRPAQDTDGKNVDVGVTSEPTHVTLPKLVAQMRLRVTELTERVSKSGVGPDGQAAPPVPLTAADLAPLLANLDNLAGAISHGGDFSFPPDMPLSKTDVRALLYKVLLRFHDELSQRGVSLELNVDPDVNYAMLNQPKIREVLSELMRNALNALPETGGKLGLRSRLKGTYLLLEVADNGAGMETTPLDELDGEKPRPYHTGLKLTKAIAEQHGGELNINSEPGKGTVVQMVLPLRNET